MDPDRTHEISEWTGAQFEEKLTKLTSSSEWKGGKLHSFTFNMAEHSLKLFEIKAVKKQSPIEELLQFGVDQARDGGMSWSDAREFVEDPGFASFYYDGYHQTKLSLFDRDIRDLSDRLKICFMLSFEIARCSLQSRKQYSEAISIALKSEDHDRAENLTNLCKMFPKSVSTKIEDDRREHALDCIFRLVFFKCFKKAMTLLILNPRSNSKKTFCSSNYWLRGISFLALFSGIHYSLYFFLAACFCRKKGQCCGISVVTNFFPIST